MESGAVSNMLPLAQVCVGSTRFGTGWTRFLWRTERDGHFAAGAPPIPRYGLDLATLLGSSRTVGSPAQSTSVMH